MSKTCGVDDRKKVRNIRSIPAHSKRHLGPSGIERRSSPSYYGHMNRFLPKYTTPRNLLSGVASAQSLSLTLLLILFTLSGCDSGLEPPEDFGTGSIDVAVTYSGEWPPGQELNDLRFIAMRFLPADTSDFFRLNEMIISTRLATNVPSDVFRIENAPAGTYFYTGIAQQFSDNLLSWRPIGLYEDNSGVFSIGRGQEVSLDVHVDFANLPEFPPR